MTVIYGINKCRCFIKKLRKNMDSDNYNQHNDEDMVADSSVKKSLLKSVSGTALKIGSFGILSLLLVGGGALYLNRVSLSQAIIKNTMTSKGVTSDVKIAKLGVGGVEFSVLSIGEKGKETLVARDGYLKWHYSFTEGKLIIDDFRAGSVDVNLGFSKDGLDLRDFKKFMGGATKENQASPIAIDAIDAGNININFITNYGIIENHGFARGTRKSGFVIGFRSFLPEKIDATRKPIGIGIATGDMTGGKFTIGAALKTNGNDFAADEIVKNIRLKGFRTTLSANLITNQKFDDVAISLKPSQIFADNFSGNGAVINNFLGTIDKFNWQSGKAPLKDAIIGANGKLTLGSAKIAGNAIGASNLGFDFSRGKGGKSKLDASLSSGGINTKFGGGNIIIKSLSDFEIVDLSAFNPENLSSQIAVNGSGIRGGEIEKILQQTRVAGFKIGNSLGVNSKLLLTKKGDKIAVYLDKAVEVSDNAGTKLVFQDGGAGAHISSYNLEKRGNEWLGALIAKGQLSLNSNFGHMSSEIKGVNISPELTGFEIGETSLNNFRFSDFTLSGTINGAKYTIAANQAAKGNISGNLVAQSAKYALSPSLLRFDGQVNGEKMALNAIGQIKNLDAGSLRLINSDIKLSANTGSNGVIAGSLQANATKLILNREYAFNNTSLALPFNVITKQGGLTINSDALVLNATSLNSPNMKSSAVKLNGALRADIYGDRMAFNAPKCLDINLQDFSANDYYLKNATGHLCPDNAGRLALIDNGQAAIYARTLIDGTQVRMGSGEDAQTISFAGLDGSFTGGKNGEIIYGGNVRNLDFRIKTGDNQFGNFNAANAHIGMNIKGGNTTITGTLSQISAKNMPMTLDGSANATISLAQNGGMNGKFDFKDLRVKDAEKDKRFGDLILSGTGNLKNNHLFLQGIINHEASANQIAAFYINHELSTGEGSADINATALKFYPYNNSEKKPKFGIEDLAPMLRGILVDTSGIVNGDARFEWGGGKALKSSASINTDGLDFNTMPAQFYGVAGNLVFDDLLTLKTASHQEIRVKEFNPGIPLENGVLTFSLDGDNSINVIGAEWPLADGKLRLNPAKIDLSQSDKFLTIAADNIDIAKLLLLTKVPNLEVEGRMSGILPVRVVDNDVEIVAGKLIADENGGILRYVGPDVSGKQPETPSKIEKIKEKFTGKPAPQGAELAVQALRNLHYKVLAMEINGRITGDMSFKLTIEGNNPDLLAGAGFRFNVGLNAPIGGLRKFYQNAFEFDTNTIKRNDDGTYQYVPTMGNETPK
jgi:hypothetical protein